MPWDRRSQGVTGHSLCTNPVSGGEAETAVIRSWLGIGNAWLFSRQGSEEALQGSSAILARWGRQRIINYRRHGESSDKQLC